MYIYVLMNSGWWFEPTPRKYEFVNWDDDISNIWKVQNVPKHQPEFGVGHFFSICRNSLPLRGCNIEAIILWRLGLPDVGYFVGWSTLASNTDSYCIATINGTVLRRLFHAVYCIHGYSIYIYIHMDDSIYIYICNSYLRAHTHSGLNHIRSAFFAELAH